MDEAEVKVIKNIVWGIVTGVCVLIVTIACYEAHQNYLTEQAMEVEGNDALAVGCALNNVATPSALCTIIAAKR